MPVRATLVPPAGPLAGEADDPPAGAPTGLLASAAADAGVTIASGQLEASNVNAAAALVEMIQLSRSYEMQVRAMHAADDNDAATARLMRAGG